ncbi:PQQ-dependent sugar dehydrogenase [Paenibacillus sp. KS-LC4]|uniref:PQQ-dependent sugar dehydrogenase n=1 Tax=Paenibacillus sp. KS-LC4 TaxID=2979727 RepID=UPI0030D2C52F
MLSLKRISTLLTFSICIGLLAACGQNDAPGAIQFTSAASPKATFDSAVSEMTASPEFNAGSTEAYEVIAEKLRAPWVIAFADDVIYVSEREGHIVKIEGKQQTRQNVYLTKSVQGGGEGGLLGFLLAPDFEQSQLAYAYHTYEEGGETLNRIVQLKYTGESWEEAHALLEGIPGAFNHNGGRMAYGPDKLLYITTGDAQQPELSQDTRSLAGKILRMTLDGKVPADNPFAGSYVFSYGHRNPQGLAWTDKGVMLVTEHGPSGSPGGHDEINVIEPGGNYGWPNVYGDQTGSGLIPPVYHSGEPAIAPSGAAIDDQNRMLIATLAGRSLYRYNLETTEMAVVFNGEGRLRDVKLKDGRVYVITNNTDGRGSPSATDDRLLLLTSLK